MKRILYIATLIIVIGLPLHAENLIGVGDSIAHNAYWDGDEWQSCNNAYDELIIDLGHPTWTYANLGVNGQTAAYVDTNIESWLSTYSPSVVYLNAGTNDRCYWGTSLSAYLASVASIKTKCTAGSAELIVNQLLPRSDCIDTVMLTNAALEDQCRTSSVKVAPTNQELQDSTNDFYLSAIYASDPAPSVHPTQAGYTVLGHLMSHSAVPAQKRVYGAAAYPDFGYVSWKWWVLSGTAAIQNDSDRGELVLAQNDSAVSSVECLPSGSKTINLSAVMFSGACNLYYRTSATTNFTRASAGAWTAYTGAVTTTDQFVQMKIENTAATPAVVRYAGMTWTGSALGDETDSVPAMVGTTWTNASPR